MMRLLLPQWRGLACFVSGGGDPRPVPVWLGRRALDGKWSATVLLLLLASGCGGRPETDVAEVKFAMSAVQSEDKSVELRVLVSPSELEVGKKANITVEAIADAKHVITLSEYEPALRQSEHAYDWRVRTGARAPAVPAGGQRLAWRETYEIEFVLPGEYTLPAATLTYTAPVAEGTHAEALSPARLATETLRVVVLAQGGTAASDADLRTVTVLEPVELPPRRSRWWWLGPLLGLGLLAAVATGWFIAARWLPKLRRWFTGKRGSAPAVASAVPEPPADQWALGRLRALLARDDLSRGLFREFYYELSDIVRGYIERRFKVSAPEMTTEEFLAAAADDGRFGPELAEVVGRFLQACDLVKYAACRPGRADAEALVEAAREFVERTRYGGSDAGGNGRMPRIPAAAVR